MSKKLGVKEAALRMQRESMADEQRQTKKKAEANGQDLTVPEDLDIPAFLKRPPETPEDHEKRMKKYRRKDSSAGLKVKELPVPTPDKIKKAIARDLKGDADEPDDKSPAESPAANADGKKEATMSKSSKKQATQKARTNVKAQTKKTKTAPKETTRHVYDWKGARAAAEKGVVPQPPDFSANTHKSYRPLLETVVGIVKSRDLNKLQAFKIKGTCTSPTAVKKYREIAVIALKAKKAA